MVILKIQNGILEECTAEELKKNNFHYRITTASKEFSVVDYDKDLARPYVKALLAKVNKLKEVKMLWFLIIAFCISMIGMFIMLFVEIYKTNSIIEGLTEIKTIQKSNTVIKTSDNLNRRLPIYPEASENIARDKIYGQKSLINGGK